VSHLLQSAKKLRHNNFAPEQQRYGARFMKSRVSRMLSILLASSSAPLLGAEFGFVGHWTNGSSMECPFYFPEEPLIAWDQIGEPPVTVSEANAILREWVDSKYPGDESLIISYQLLNVRPWQQEYKWAYFIEYAVFKNRAPIIRSNEKELLAITMNRTVLTPQCAAP
jgi:hypothetical protein